MSDSGAAAKRTRILIIRNAYVYDYGGGEKFPVYLAGALRRRNYEPTVVSRSPKLLAFAASESVPVIRGWWWSRQNWSGRGVFLFPAYLTWQLLLTVWYVQLIVRIRPDIVHPQSKDDFVAATLAARLLGKRVVWTDHADLKYVFANHRVWYKNPVGKLVYWCGRFAERVTLVSNSEKQLIEEALGQQLTSTFQVIHNGIFDTSVEPAPVESTAFVFSATSRLVAAKGIGELITAFKQLHAEHPRSELLLVGDGPERQKFVDLAAGDHAIHFIGHSDAPLPYVAASDVFVHPSHHEGFSLSLIEAAMLAKPIIACDVGGNPEIIRSGANGLLVPARDSTALYRAMAQLLADERLRAEFGRAARQTFTAEFDFEKITQEEFIPIYENR